MKIHQGLCTILLTICLLSATITNVMAMPPLPSSFYGTVKVNGANIAAGSKVSAWINGKKYAETTVQTFGGDTVYSLVVAGDDSGTQDQVEGGVAGDVVVFKVNALTVKQTGTWSSGVDTELNLTYQENSAPEITEGGAKAVSMSEDGSPTAFSLTLHATDADNDPLTWSLQSSAQHGAASASGTGAARSIAYTPQANYFGSDSFIVRVSDGNGGTDAITVNVEIGAVNDAPVAVNDSYIAQSGQTLTVTAAQGLLANDSDIDSNKLTAVLAAQPAQGTLTLSADGSFTYLPAAGFIGTVTFSYRASDGAAQSAIAQVKIEVKEVSPIDTTTHIYLPVVIR
jgi:hypothetical protein